MLKFKRGLMWFQRDLRIEGNAALLQALHEKLGDDLGQRAHSIHACKQNRSH